MFTNNSNNVCALCDILLNTLKTIETHVTYTDTKTHTSTHDTFREEHDDTRYTPNAQCL